MAAYPLAPRFGKMLLLSQQHDLMQLSITLVAALSVQELMLEQPADADGGGETHRKWLGQRRSWAGAGESLLLGDPMVLLRAVGAAEYSGDIEAFCLANGIRSKALREVRKLRVQLTNETNLILPAGAEPVTVDPRMPPPTEFQVCFFLNYIESHYYLVSVKKFSSLLIYLSSFFRQSSYGRSF